VGQPNHNVPTIPQLADSAGISRQFSPLRFLVITIGGIFLAEVAAMILLINFRDLPYYLQTFIDASIMIMMIFPLVYFFSLKPLIQHIEKQQQTEQALGRSNDLLSRAEQIGSLGSWAWDISEDRVVWSEGLYRIFGLTPQDFGATYRAYLDRVHREDREYVRRVVGTASREHGMFEYENRIVRPDGQIRVVYTRGEVILDEGGRPARLLGLGIDVTERRRTQATNRQLSRIVEQTADTVVVTDYQGRIEYVNPAFEHLTGFTREEVLGTTPRILKSGIHADSFYQEVWGTILRGEVFFGEIADCKKDSELFHEVKTITPLRDIQGKITHFVATGKDITKHKHDEEELGRAYAEMELRVHERTEELRTANMELRESEQRLNRAQEIAHLGSWHLDLLNDRLTWSDEVYRIFGLQPQEFAATYEAFLEAVHPDDRAAVDAAYSGSVREGRDGYEIEHRVVRRPSNETRYVHEKCQHLRNETGQVIRSIGMVHDITEHKLAEQALRAAHDELELRVQERTQALAIANQELLAEIAERKEVERQLRIQTTAMEAAANGILITDRLGTILWANPALARMSGYSEHELLGQSTRLFRSGQHDPDFYRQMWATVLTGDVWQGETTNRCKDGSLYVEEQTIAPVRGEDAEISHFIAIKQDITERKFIDAQLQESNRQLTALSESEHRQRLLAEGLSESSIALNMSLELDSVLDHIFEQTRRTIPFTVADVALIEDGRVRIARTWGIGETANGNEKNYAINEFPIWETVCETKSTQLIPDTSIEKQWTTYREIPCIRSYMAAPLIYNDTVIGIINVGSDHHHAFDSSTSNNLRAFAASAAVAIQNARLYEAEQLNRKVAEILNDASVALARTLDIQLVLKTILDYAQMILPLDVVFILLREDNDRYRIRSVRARDQDDLESILLNRSIDLLDEPVIKPFFENLKSTLISDASEMEEWAPPAQLASMRSWLGIPLDSMGKIIGMVVAASATAGSFRSDQIHLAEAVVGQASVALQNAWLFEQVRSGRERLQQLSRHLVDIQEDERKYIARELHDETGQALTSLKLGLRAIEVEARGQANITEKVGSLKILADGILEGIHRLAVNLRPASLDHLGLAEAITSLIELISQGSGITARFKILGTAVRERLTEDIEASIYRIVQESLTNVIRHAHATRADVILEWQDEKIVIIIEDDGVGFDMQSARNADQLGLLGMQERAEMLGGALLIDSTPKMGTTLVVEIPYVHSNTDNR
jgi:PAS domain S-box-containing protein